MNDEARVVLFVYGTLRRGEPAHDVLGPDAEWLGPHRLRGHVLFDLGPYPGMAQGDGVVVGERVRVPSSRLAAIDAYEGEGYRRVLVDDGAEPLVTYVLVEVPATARPLPSGDAPRHRAPR